MATRNIALPELLEEQIDREARRLGLSFSAFLRLLAQQYFDGITFERKGIGRGMKLPTLKPSQ